MLTTQGDAGSTVTCDNNVVDKAREGRNAADEEREDRAPIGAKFWRVAVHAVEVVHVRDGYVATSDNKVTVARDNRISHLDT